MLLNCDMGEGLAAPLDKIDKQLMPYIDLANIACGAHGSNDDIIKRTIDLAIKYDKKIAAHPSFPDIKNFGRKYITLSSEQLIETLHVQIDKTQDFCKELGGVLSYVKPHGALYNAAAKNEHECLALIAVIKQKKLKFMGMAASLMEQLSAQHEIEFISEAFADRKYKNLVELEKRNIPGAVLNSVEEIKKQAIDISKGHIRLSNGIIEAINAKSICIHGDSPQALASAKILHEIFEK